MVMIVKILAKIWSHPYRLMTKAEGKRVQPVMENWVGEDTRVRRSVEERYGPREIYYEERRKRRRGLFLEDGTWLAVDVGILL